jgi:hypothetical protein
VRTAKSRGKLVIGAALAAVLGLASPAAAVGSTTTVTATQFSTALGTAVQLQAAVACDSDPSADMGVTFWDGADELATVSVGPDGKASQFALFTTGTHKVTAAYSGNGTCDASSGSTTVEVTAATTPPGQPPLCLLTCGGGLISINEGDIYNQTNHIDIDNTEIYKAKPQHEPRHK